MNTAILDHATSEIASASKLGIDAMKTPPGEGFILSWPPRINMDEAARTKVENFRGIA